MPTADGRITGTYFYKSKYIPILLEGKKINNKIELTERNRSNTITGIFTLKEKGDSLIGHWKNTKRNILYDVLLLKSDAKYKPKEKIDVGHFAVDSTDIESGYTTTSYKDLLFARKGIYTYYEGTTISGGSYPIGEARTYTLIPDSTGVLQELSLWDEIDVNEAQELRKTINSHIQNCFDDTRKIMSDSAWTQLLITGDSYRVFIDSSYTLDSVFTWKDNGSQVLSYMHYIDERGLTFYYFDYFGFVSHHNIPYDLSCEFIISFDELKRYLSNKSVLRRLVDK